MLEFVRNIKTLKKYGYLYRKILTKKSAYYKGIIHSLCKVYNVFTLMFGIQRKDLMHQSIPPVPIPPPPSRANPRALASGVGTL